MISSEVPVSVSEIPSCPTSLSRTLFSIPFHARRAMAAASRCPRGQQPIFLPLNTRQILSPTTYESYRGSLISFPPFPPDRRKRQRHPRQRKITFCSACSASSPVRDQTPLDLHPLHPLPGSPKSRPRKGPRPPALVVGAAISHRTAPVSPAPLGGVSLLVPSHVVWVVRGVVGLTNQSSPRFRPRHLSTRSWAPYWWVGRIVIDRKKSTTHLALHCRTRSRIFGGQTDPHSFCPPLGRAGWLTGRVAGVAVAGVAFYHGLSVRPPTDLVIVVMNCWRSPSL